MRKNEINIGEIVVYGGRNYIKTEEGLKAYAVEVAKNHPDVCGVWFDGCQVHHINRNPTDDRPENLICVTSAVHHEIHSKAVDVFYKGSYLGRYSSYSEAAKEFNFPPGVISSYIKHNKPYSLKYRHWRFSNVVS